MPRVYRNALRRRSETQDAVQAALAGYSGAERVLQFFRKILRHIQGPERGKPFEPLPFQVDWLRSIYDPRHADGRRKVREALFMLPRKNGKTALCGGLGLFHIFAGEHLGQIIAAANSREQAGLLFTAAAEMLDVSPILRSRAGASPVSRRRDRLGAGVAARGLAGALQTPRPERRARRC